MEGLNREKEKDKKTEMSFLVGGSKKPHSNQTRTVMALP